MIPRAQIPPVDLSTLPAAPALRILLLPDLHLPRGPEQKRCLLSRRAFLNDHDWVVLLGDVAGSYGTPGEYAHIDSFIRQLERPYSVVNGNHEFFFEPIPDESPEYGKVFRAASAPTQLSLHERFKRFYSLERVHASRIFDTFGIALLGIDRMDEADTILMSDDSAQWLSQTLDDMAQVPLFLLCHVPLADPQLDRLRYYSPGRRPYLLPPEEIRQKLARRQKPTFWFSGHLHLMPGHPLSTPYKTVDGVWQVHCPDGWGWGRKDDQEWSPKSYDGLFVRSLMISTDAATVQTIDLKTEAVIATTRFDL